MIRRDLLEALVAALRPGDAPRLLGFLTGPHAREVAERGTTLAARPRLERAAALAATLRACIPAKGGHPGSFARGAR